MKSACASLLIILISVLAGALSPDARAQSPAGTPPPFTMPEQFSVNVTVLASGNVVKATMFVSKEKFRSDAESPVGKQTRILRQDIKKQYDLYYKENRYTEAPFSKDLSKLMFGLPAIGNWEKTGQEPLNTRNVDKYQFTTAANATEKLHYWVDPETQCPLKIEAETPTARGTPQIITMEFSNYKIEPQPDSVFEPPVGSKAKP
ncbi:MAG: hypothetical protein ACAI35_01115 [Candidatus Methylacidiphilales bacterium]|nr:hypothetical protein [Candidatus Methylacidiphilales bacterium]